jgi:hypothetical protein
VGLAQRKDNAAKRHEARANQLRAEASRLREKYNAYRAGQVAS